MVEVRIAVTQIVQEENEDVAEDEVAEYGPVVKTWGVVDLGTQESILTATLVLAEKAPVHVDVPDELVRGLD